MKEDFSPNPSSRTFAMAETGFSQGENTAFGDFDKFLKKRLKKPALQQNLRTSSLFESIVGIRSFTMPKRAFFQGEMLCFRRR